MISLLGILANLSFLSYDIDISGCYNRAMGISDYPLGSPVIFTCKTSKKKEKIISNVKIKTKKVVIIKLDIGLKLINLLFRWKL